MNGGSGASPAYRLDPGTLLNQCRLHKTFKYGRRERERERESFIRNNPTGSRASPA